MAIVKALGTVSSLTFLSRLTGLARDIIIQAIFPVGAATDAFWTAFRIPNLFRRLVAEGSFSMAFVPVLAEYRAANDEAKLREFIAVVSASLLTVLLLLSALGCLIAGYFWQQASDGPTGKDTLTAALTVLTFPYILFISLTALSGAILNSYKKFALAAATPIVLNLCLIVGALLLGPKLAIPIYALAWAVLAAGVVQFLIQLPALRAIGVLNWPRFDWQHKGMRKVLALMGPTILGSSAAQLNILVSTVLAYQMIDGSVSWLSLSDRLLEFPLGIFGVALGTVILPHLSERHAAGDQEHFRRSLDWALRLGLLISVPATAGLVLLAGPLISTLFLRGAFTPYDVEMASKSVMVLACGLPGFVLVKVLAPAFYAKQDPKTPVRIGLVCLSFSLVMNFVLVAIAYDQAWQAPHVALAISSAAGGLLNALLLGIFAHRQGTLVIGAGFWPFLGALLLSTLVMGIGLYHWVPATEVWVQAAESKRIGWMLATVALAGAGGLGCFALLGGFRKRVLPRSP
jgi:putative peptidoglycan lipid II flippase